MFGSRQTLTVFPVRVFISPFHLRKCLTNSGRYMFLQGTKDTSNAMCSATDLVHRDHSWYRPTHRESVKVAFTMNMKTFSGEKENDFSEERPIFEL